jgi:hypothetical protein
MFFRVNEATRFLNGIATPPTFGDGGMPWQKPVPSAYNLRTPAGDRILFPVSGAQLQFFRAKTRPENAVGMVGTEVGALFRV